MKTQNNYCRYPWLLWMVREKSGESGRCLFSQLLQWSPVIPNICKLKFVLSGMLGINDWLFLLVPNPPTAWHGSSPLKNQPNGIWDRFLDSPDMSAKSRMIKKQYNRFSQHKKPGLMEVALNTTEILSGKTYEDYEVITVLHVHQLVAQMKVHVPHLVDNVMGNLLFPQMFLCKQQGK